MSILAMAVVTCSDKPAGTANSAPQIHDIRIAPPLPVGIGTTVDLTCDASDVDHDALSYDWSADGGVFVSATNQAQVSWQAPVAPRECVISVSVMDGHSNSVESITLTVRSVPTVIIEIHPSSGTTATTFALDASGSVDLTTPSDQLEVRWNIVSEWTPWSTDKTTTHRFESSGTHDVTLQVRNNDGMAAERDTSVFVETTPFTIENLGVRFGPYSPETNYAGDFYFSRFISRPFFEFGARVKDTEGNIKELGEFSYFIRKDASIVAISEGEVVSLNYQSESDDYELAIRSLNDSAYDVIYDHVINVRVPIGGQVRAGDTLANPHYWPGWDVGHVEITIANRFTQLFYCPFCCVDDGTTEAYQQAVLQLIHDWESFVGDSTIYDEENWFVSGCRYESLPSF